MTNVRIADDFESIARTLKEARTVPVGQTAADEPVCARCEGGGWVQVYSPHPPAFEVCPDCYNPEGLPCP